MAQKESTSRVPDNPELVTAMGAILGLMLDDTRAQYRHVRYEYGRLKKAGVAVSQIMAELGFRVLPTVLYGLYGVAVLTMLLVREHTSYREKHNLIALIIVIQIQSVVFRLIIDLDRSNIGQIKISQEAPLDLQENRISTP